MIDDFLVKTGIAPAWLYVLDNGVKRVRTDDEYLIRRGRWIVESRMTWKGNRESGSAIEYTRLSSKAQARRLIRALVAAGHRGRLLRQGRFRVSWHTHTAYGPAIFYRRTPDGSPIEYPIV